MAQAKKLYELSLRLNASREKNTGSRLRWDRHSVVMDVDQVIFRPSKLPHVMNP